MMQGVDPGGDMLLAQLTRMQDRMSKAQREISSGLGVTTASDAPDRVSDILQMRAELARTAQIGTNLGQAQAEAQTADQVLQQSVKLMDSARSAGAQGAGDLNTDQRAAAAQQVRDVLAQLVSLSRTSTEGRYIFSGDMDQVPCYELNSESPTGVGQLAAPEATRRVEHPSGVSFEVSRTAQQIFDDRNPDGTPSAENAFAALHDLAAALENNDDQGIGAALDGLDQAAAHVNAQLGFYGSTENRIAAGINDAASQKVRLTAALSERQDADVTASILELQQMQLNQSAALTARGQIKTRTLFDYLP